MKNNERELIFELSEMQRQNKEILHILRKTVDLLTVETERRKGETTKKILEIQEAEDEKHN
jgi:hypothetical protein